MHDKLNEMRTNGIKAMADQLDDRREASERTLLDKIEELQRNVSSLTTRVEEAEIVGTNYRDRRNYSSEMEC